MAEIVSVDRIAALALVRRSCLVETVSAPEVDLHQRPVHVHVETVADGLAVRLVLKNISGVVAERALAAGRVAGNECAREWRIDVHEALRMARAGMPVSQRELYVFGQCAFHGEHEPQRAPRYEVVCNDAANLRL